MKRVFLIRFRIDFAAHCNVGPAKIQLLEEIGRSGSERYREAEQKLNEVAGEYLGVIAKQVNRDAAAATPKVPLSAKRRR